MRNFQKEINKVDGYSHQEVTDKKINLLIQEVIELGKMVELQAKDYVVNRHKSAQSLAGQEEKVQDDKPPPTTPKKKKAVNV